MHKRLRGPAKASRVFGQKPALPKLSLRELGSSHQPSGHALPHTTNLFAQPRPKQLGWHRASFIDPGISASEDGPQIKRKVNPCPTAALPGAAALPAWGEGQGGKISFIFPATL